MSMNKLLYIKISSNYHKNVCKRGTKDTKGTVKGDGIDLSCQTNLS